MRSLIYHCCHHNLFPLKRLCIMSLEAEGDGTLPLTRGDDGHSLFVLKHTRHTVLLTPGCHSTGLK